eukprot:TRINITY_DN42677_c0_g1_i1.p1 TRINITY_DN42677_c0_g1~~TRINITY_DN42677_c0_g1_i1.p1  ORF type:complete len:515 (-),score=47.50 TRINITY_DN42677_c0_g1_i1:143-1687(-)
MLALLTVVLGLVSSSASDAYAGGRGGGVPPFESSAPWQKRLGLKLQSELSALLSETVNASAKTTNPMGGTPTSAAMQVRYKDEILAETYIGHVDAEERIPLDRTIFRIGSVTKVFPVLMLYQLYERGVVRSLDDPISAYEPSFNAVNSYSNSSRQFTLRQLASQLSGLPRDAPCPLFGDCDVSTDEILKRWNSTPGAIFPEYTQPSYSNFAYALLGNTLAAKVDMSFAEYVQNEILNPLGMVDTGFLYTESVLKRMAKAYSSEAEIPMYDLGWVAPAGQMYSTVRDMSRLCSFYLGSDSGGGILDDSLRRQLMLPEFVLQGGRSLIGAPWEIQMLEDGWPLVGKAGNVPGYSAYTGVVPALNISIVVLWSGAAGQSTFSMPAKMLNVMLPQFLPLLELPRPGIPNNPSAYIGSYHADVPFFGQLTYNISNGSLPDNSWGLILVSGADNMTMWLDFKNDSIATMTRREAVREHSLMDMLMALDNEWVVFKLEPNGVVSFTLPGLHYGSPFQHAII